MFKTRTNNNNNNMRFFLIQRKYRDWSPAFSQFVVLFSLSKWDVRLNIYTDIFIYNVCDTFIVSLRNTIAEIGRLETYCTDHGVSTPCQWCFLETDSTKLYGKEQPGYSAFYFLLYRIKKLIKTNMTLGWADENICLNYSFKTVNI